MAHQDDLTSERAASVDVRKALAEKVKGLLVNGLTHEENQIWLANVNAFEGRAYQRGRQEALREACKLVSDYNCMHDHGKKATKACDDIFEQLDRLASEGG